MIKKLFKRVFGKTPPVRVVGAAHVIPYEAHKVSRDGISYGARRVTDGLQAAGFQAFVVGGAVRDLLLDRQPKDFDVATDATPEEVRRVFRRSRIIGRRFRLVHVMFGEETVEVSTFRRAIEAEDAETDEHGRILRDNEFGDQEQDAARRDFTANALFYDPSTQEIFDYHNGYADIRANTLRMIGDPEVRYRERPGAHAAGSAALRQAGHEAGPGHCRADCQNEGVVEQRAGGAAVRRNAQAVVVRPGMPCIKKLRAMDYIMACCPCWT